VDESLHDRERLLSEADIEKLIEADAWMMDALRAVQTLQLPDWWISAGFVRNKVWDALHGYAERTPLADVDVVYFDAENTDRAAERAHEAALLGLRPDVPWSVKNQARMHERNGDEPYANALEAIARFVETPTGVAATLRADGSVRYAAPGGGHGDLVRLIVRPCAAVLDALADKGSVYERRIAEKRWQKTWPKLRIVPLPEAHL